MQEEIKKRGGARQGAGRKRGENARNIRASFMLSPKADAVLKARAEEAGVSRNDVINTLLEKLCSRES